MQIKINIFNFCYSKLNKIPKQFLFFRREAGRRTWTPVAGEVRKTTWKVEDLLHRNEYNFRVIAHNKVGPGKPTELTKDIMALDPLTTPSPPLNLQWSDVRAKSVILSWKRPETDGGCVITGYCVDMKEKDSDTWRPVIRHHESTSVTVLGQIEGIEYCYRVAALNRIGIGQTTETSQAILAADPLAPPKIQIDSSIKKGIEVLAGKRLKIEAICYGVPHPTVTWSHDDGGTVKAVESTKDLVLGSNADDSSISLSVSKAKRSHKGRYIINAENNQGKDSVHISVNVLDVPDACKGPWSFEDGTNEAVTVYWKAPGDDGGSDIINYVLEMKESNKKTWNLVSSTVQSPKLRVTKLVEGKEYVFRVCAENKLGKSPWLEAAPYIAKLPFDPPSAPEKPIITEASRKSISLKWNEPQDGGSTIVGYWLEKKESYSSRWTKACRDLIRKTEYQLTAGLQEGSTYQFRISAENAAGPGKYSPPSDYQTCEDPVSAPSPPQKPRVEDTTKTSITLAWDRPENDGGDQKLTYIIEQCLSDGSWSKCNDKNYEASTFTVENLLEGIMYSFRIKAANRGGESKPALVAETAAREMIDLPRIELHISVANGITVKAGKKFSIPVIVTGRPYPEVTWSKNGKEIDGDRFVSEKSENGYIGKVKSCKRSDWGDYKITAKNSCGTKSVTCHVEVHDVPNLVKDFKCSAVSKNVITLKWHAPEDTGGLPIKAYHLEKRDMTMRAWLSVGSTDKFSKDVTNVLENSTYSFRICAENEMGKSDFVETIPVRCQDALVAPDRPENVRIEDIKDTNVTLRWIQPRFDGGSKINGYNVDRRLDDTEEWISCNSRLIVDRKAVVDNLEKGKKYVFRVKAINNIGESEAAVSRMVVVKEPEATPDVKLDVGVKGTLQLRAGEALYLCAKVFGVPYPDISWIKGEDQTLKETENLKIIKKDKEVTLCIEKSVRADTGFYAVVATNSNGSKSARCNVLVEDVPSPPLNLKPAKVTSESVILTWNVPEDNGGADILNYVVEKREGKNKNWTQVNGTVIDFKYRVTKLTSGSEYQFRVAGENKFGIGCFAETNSIIAKNPFDVPGPPFKPSVTEVTKTSMLVTWQPPANNNGAEIEGYWLEMRDNDSTRWKKVSRSPITKPPLLSCSFKVLKLSEGLEYRFRACAVNKAGAGPMSEESDPVTAEDPVMRPGTPPAPEVTQVTNNSISLRIKPIPDSEKEIIGYVVEYQDDISGEWEKFKLGDSHVLSAKEITLPDLKTGFRYKFRVFAVNKGGESEPSEQTSLIEVKERVGKFCIVYVCLSSCFIRKTLLTQQVERSLRNILGKHNLL